MPNLVINEKTQHRQYPKPHIQNDGEQDVERLRTALDQLDTDIQSLSNQTAGLASNKTEKSTSDELQAQLNYLSALLHSTL